MINRKVSVRTIANEFGKAEKTIENRVYKGEFPPPDGFYGKGTKSAWWFRETVEACKKKPYRGPKLLSMYPTLNAKKAARLSAIPLASAAEILAEFEATDKTVPTIRTVIADALRDEYESPSAQELKPDLFNHADAHESRLRDEFAKIALTEMMKRDYLTNEIGLHCYSVADSMILARRS